MDHLDSFIHSKTTKSHSARSQGWASSSRVIAEEVGEQLKKKYCRYKESTNDFNWDSNKPDPPMKCEEAQCGLNSGSEESCDDFEDNVEQNKKRKRLISQKKDITNPTLYGFGNSDCDKLKDLKVTEKFQMTRLFNLLWLLPHMLPGLHSSYYFYGTLHSTFPVHVEDGLTCSGNVLYAGQPKLWVMIPPWATSLLEYHLKKCGSFLVYMHCSNFLGHKSLLPTIQGLLEFNIPFKIVVQHPGDMVILYPNTAHYGFNLGRNFAEAINFALPSWIPWGAMARKCSCFPKQIHIPMKPFIVAFRPDLLEDFEHGRAITTPFFVRGMRLLASEIERISKIHSKTLEKDSPSPGHLRSRRNFKNCPLKQDNSPPSSLCSILGKDRKKVLLVQAESGPSTEAKTCPLPKCSIMCSTKTEMLKHVRTSHHPLMSDNNFLDNIDKLFK